MKGCSVNNIQKLRIVWQCNEHTCRRISSSYDWVIIISLLDRQSTVLFFLSCFESGRLSLGLSAVLYIVHSSVEEDWVKNGTAKFKGIIFISVINL